MRVEAPYALLIVALLACGGDEAPEDEQLHRFHVTVEGRNHLLKLDGDLRRVAFSAPRTVRAPTPEDAITAALQLVRDDPLWIGRLENRESQDDAPRLFATDVERLANSDDDAPDPPGLEYDFYDDDGS